MTNTQLLKAIWSRSRGKYVFLPYRTPEGEWVESPPFTPEDDRNLLVADNALPFGDVYFTPVRYNGPRRLPEHQGEIGVLYADLDGEYDREAFSVIPPTVWWETSPGNEQAIWFLTRAVPAEQAIELNRKLSLYLDADHGSWIPTKVLRIPGSVNYKRGKVTGRILSYDPSIEYDPDLLAEDIPDVKPRVFLPDISHPPVPSKTEWEALLRKVWPRLDHRTRVLISQAQVSDRSLHLSRLANAMARVSLSAPEIFGTLSRLATNKFIGRPDVLWKSVVLPAVEGHD